DEAIGAALPAGEDVPGVRPYRAHPGVAIKPVKVKLQIGDLVKTKTVNSDHKEVTFQLELKPETTTMSAVFLTENGEEYGAYYAYIEKKN
ncbi:MAG TPA: N-acetylgalactosamine-4-sulfatase, partial [Planctomycetaceae bacterium]|nr:N-acetylgalactosamine-4-sulfatase [Planctomycetaceae bacterium]